MMKCSQVLVYPEHPSSGGKIMSVEKLEGLKPETREAIKRSGLLIADEVLIQIVTSYRNGDNLLVKYSPENESYRTLVACALDQVKKEKLALQVLVVSHSPSDALKIYAMMRKFNEQTARSIHAFVSGFRLANDKKVLKAKGKGVQVMVGTTGRILDLHSKGLIDVRKVRMLVMDSADELLDSMMGHSPQSVHFNPILFILPQKLQFLLFVHEISDKAEMFVRDPGARLFRRIFNSCPALILSRLPCIQDQFESFFKEGKRRELKRIYLLLFRVDRALDRMLTFTETYIKEDGLNAVKAVAKSAIDNPEQYVHTILEVYKRYDSLLTSAFARDPRFIRSMDKAYTAFINQNAVTDAAQSVNKSSELLVRYIDSLLRRPAGEQDVEALLNDAVVVFKYINDKDVFEKYYQKRLAVRIVNSVSKSDDAEAGMMTRLQQLCGHDYTSKMQKLFNDKNVSANITKLYKNEESRKGCIDLGIITLSKCVWPFNREAEEFPLPAQLSHTMQQFTTFYKTQFNGRKLELLLSRSRGEVVFNCLGRKYTFVATTAQIAILLRFNSVLQMSVGRLRKAVSMEKPLLVKNLQPMVKEKLLIVQRAATRSHEQGKLELSTDVANGTLLMFNTKFSHKKTKVDLTGLARGRDREGSRGDPEVVRLVELGRRNIIQAAIVRIMKARKRLQQAQLISEVIRQMADRFDASVPTIKKSIEELIERDYLRTVVDDPDSYEYVA